MSASTSSIRPSCPGASASYAASHSPSPLHADLPSMSQLSPPPHVDYPPSEKSESMEEAHLPQHIPYRPQNASQHGLYGQRRIPCNLEEEVVSPTRSRSIDWRSWIRPKEGGLGRALILGWVFTTGLFLLATAFWRGQLFSGESASQIGSDI